MAQQGAVARQVEEKPRGGLGVSRRPVPSLGFDRLANADHGWAENLLKGNKLRWELFLIFYACAAALVAPMSTAGRAENFFQPEPYASDADDGTVIDSADDQDVLRGPNERIRIFQEPSSIPDYQEGVVESLPSISGEPSSIAAGEGFEPLEGTFGRGFQFRTADEQFLMQFHLSSQLEARVWDRTDQDPVQNGIYLPRQRIFFRGHITRPVEYLFSINRGLGDLNLLDAYVNFHPSDQFEIRIGRYLTPLTYDQFAISHAWLPTPERSLFTTNLGLNRQFGAMAWGYVLDETLDYAVGVFNGPRNSFEDFNDGKDVIGFLNLRPFGNSQGCAQHWNVGTSVAFGRQDQTPIPRAFRVGTAASNAAGAAAAAAPFLAFEPDVVERGDRLVGSVHSAWFFRSLSLIAEWQYGYANYAAGSAEASRIPLSGYYVTAGYFLTGEEVKRRAVVRPLRPFLRRKRDDPRGPGAWELVTRASQMELGEEVFATGLSDPNRWSNEAFTTELGTNWYLNDFTKIYMFWLHADFADPVEYRPGGLQKSADMFWLRCQLFF